MLVSVVIVGVCLLGEELVTNCNVYVTLLPTSLTKDVFFGNYRQLLIIVTDNNITNEFLTVGKS